MPSFLRPKKGKSSRGQSYYDRENMVHTLSDLASINNPKSEQVYSTNEIIKYNNLALNEIDEKGLMKVFDKPSHIISGLEDLKNYKVLFYRHSIEKFVFLMQFHCYQDNFLFVSNMVISSGILSISEKELFLNRIINKYFPELKLDFQQGFDIKITDKFKNFIKVVDGVNFRINYVNNSSVNQQILNNPKFSNERKKDDFDAKMHDYF